MHTIVEWKQKWETVLDKKRWKYGLLTDLLELSVLEMVKINKTESSLCLKTKCDSITDICEIGNIGGPKRRVLIINMLKDLLSLLSPLCQLVLGELVILPFSFWVTKQFLFLKKINNLSCARNNRSKTRQK